MYNLAEVRSLLILSVFIASDLWAQIPESLVKERSLVIVNTASVKSGQYTVRADWKEMADEVQSNLGKIGVDAVAYLHADDWDASPGSQDVYRLFFATRGIKNLIRIDETGTIVNLAVYDFQKLEKKWDTNAGSLRQAIYRLGKQIKTIGFEIENFLPAAKAEIFTDVPFSKWTASNNFPDRIKRMKIGVARRTSGAENEEMIEILSDYPFQFDLIDYVDDEDAFRQGYQYVLLHMTTTGESIQKLLNYNSPITQTDLISTTKGDSTNTKLKTIPINANVTKFYFRQTVNHEVFVGRSWDADTDWYSALENFILNLRIAFKKI